MSPMFDSWVVAGLTLAYLALLFQVARTAENSSGSPDGRAPVWPYALGLSVYCTSWSLYGTTGQVAATGWIFPPTYIGTIALFAFAAPVVRKLIAAHAAHNTTSLADFIASRYGKSRALAVLSTILAAVCAAPYIALQFKAVADSLDMLAGGSAFPIDTAFVVAAIMGVFALSFGLGRLSDSGRSKGLIAAIAVDGVLKLVAIVCVGVYGTFVLFDGPGDLITRAAEAGLLEPRDLGPAASQSFIASIALGALAILCLPQLFFMLTAEDELDKARRKRAFELYIVYLIGMGLFTWPVTAASALSGVNAGTAGYQTLLLPLETGAPAVALIVYLGGVAAATSIVIATTVAVGVMVGNEIVAPLIMRASRNAHPDLSAAVRASRRFAIAGLLALAYIYYRVSAETASSLASIGLTSMALAAQFAPALIGGLYWRRGSVGGVGTGLAAGAALWAIGFFTPVAGMIDAAGFDPHAAVLVASLSVNVLAFIGVSLLASPSMDERAQAASFVDADASLLHRLGGEVAVGDLQNLAARVVGAPAAEEAFARFRSSRGEEEPKPETPADARSLVFAERLIAGVVGAASARILMRTVADRDVAARDVAALAEEASQVFRFNRDLLQSSVDNLSTAIAVVDKHLRMVAWNRAYEELFQYPSGLLYAGRHVRDLIRYNAERGECGEGEPDDLVEKRLKHLRARTSYSFQRHRRDGVVLEIRGNPMPGGGFVTSYTDVTAFVDAERAQRELAETLERRVADRTREVESARRAAEEANASKTRLFAAVSHDILQPLNAARLLTSNIEDRMRMSGDSGLVDQLHAALDSVQELFSEVLDLARLETSPETVERAATPLQDLFDELGEVNRPVAAGKGLRLRFVPTSLIIDTDRRLVRRVLQNLVSNALRYTASGKVLVGARREGDAVRILVCDTGCGVADEDREVIFEEFRRSSASRSNAGLGLGLSIVRRISALLDHPVAFTSEIGRGSVFSIAAKRVRTSPAASNDIGDGPFDGLRVLCVEDDDQTRAAMRALLETWGCEVTTSVDGVGCDGAYDAILLDYHLGPDRTGVDAADALPKAFASSRVAVVFTSDRSAEVRAAVAARGMGFIEKPVRRAQLRAVLQSAYGRSAAE